MMVDDYGRDASRTTQSFRAEDTPSELIDALASSIGEQSMSIQERLRDCPAPWCSQSRPHYMTWINQGGHIIHCLHCGASTPVKATKEEAFAAWNERPALDQAVEALTLARVVVKAMTGTEWAGVGGFGSWQEADDSLRAIRAKIDSTLASIGGQ